MKKLLELPHRICESTCYVTDYFDAFNKSGLHISRLVEPTPTKEACQKHPGLKEGFTKPSPIIIEAVKIIMKK